MAEEEYRPTVNEEIELAELNAYQKSKPSANRSFYRPGTSRKPAGFWRRHRKKLIIGGAAASLLGAGSIFIFLFLAPLKLSFLAKNIEDVRLARMDLTFSRRSERFFVSMLAAEIAGNDANGNIYFRAKGYGGNYSIVQLYKNWRTNEAFRKLAVSQKITFVRQKGPDGIDRLRKIDLRGSEINFDELFDKNGVLRQELIPDLDNRTLDVINRDRTARRELRAAVREGTKWYQVLKRRHTRLWMAETLGVRKWTFFEGTRENARAAVRAGWTRAISSTFRSGGFLACLLDGKSCADSKSLNDADNKSRLSLEDADRKRDISEHVKVEEPEVDPARIRRAQAGAATRRFAQTVVKNMIKYIHILLVVDLVDQIHELIGQEKLASMISVARAQEYAAAFATFQTLTDQMKEGNNSEGNQMSAEEVNAALEMFDCAEFSDGFQQISAQQGADFAQSAWGRVYAQDTNSGNDECSYAEVTDELKVDSQGQLIDKIKNAYDICCGIVFAPISAVYSHTVEPVVDEVGAFVGPAIEAAFRAFLKATALEDNYEQVLGELGEKAFALLGGAPACTGTETGGRLFNCIDGGAAVTQEFFLQSAGGHLLSEQQVNQLSHLIAEDKQVELASQDWIDRLFSTQNPQSLAGQLALRLPSRSHFGQRLGQLAASWLPINWFKNAGRYLWLAQTSWAERALAATDDNLYGLKRYGFTAQELNAEPWGGKDLAACEAEIQKFQEAIEGGGEGVADQATSICQLDNMVVEVLSSYFTEADDGGLNLAISPIEASPAGNVQELAQTILSHPKISFDPGTDTPFRELAQGKLATVPAKSTKTAVSASLLSIILKLANEGIPLRIGALTTGNHDPNSFHYVGKAVDIANEEEAGRIMPFIYSNRRSFDINELIFGSPPPGTQNLDNGEPRQYDAATLQAHRGHIHFSVNN